MVEIERREFLEGAYLLVSFLLFRNKMPLQDSTNTQTRGPRRDVKDVLGRRSRDRGEGLSTLTPRVNDSSALNRILRESARQSPERQLLRRRLDEKGLREKWDSWESMGLGPPQRQNENLKNNNRLGRADCAERLI